MKSNMFCIGNEESFSLDLIPIVQKDIFRQNIINECYKGLRLINMFACYLEADDLRIFAFLGDDKEGKIFISSTLIIKNEMSFKSLTLELPQAHMFEREIAEQYKIIPEGHPWLKPLRYHHTIDNKHSYQFFKIHGDEIHEVAVGPVHAGIIEPGHFRFQCLGEEIIHLEIRLGYQHRGIENMMIKHTIERCLLLSESIAGDTTIGHAGVWCNIIESLSNCTISPRAQAIRSIALELERLANHTGDLGAICGDVGFLPSASYFGRLRGVFLNLTLELCGNRLGKSLLCPGGVIFDIDDLMIKHFRNELLIAKNELNEIAELMFNTPSVLARIEGIGTISKKTAKDLGFVGPSARTTGLEIDTRLNFPFGMYRFNHIPIATSILGDVYSRALIRWIESQRSIDFLLNILTSLPKGNIRFNNSFNLKPNAMAVSMSEGFRGEIMHVAITNNNSKMIRYKIKDPSFHNWTALTFAVRGAEISDFPLCNKSFNLSYAGHDL